MTARRVQLLRPRYPSGRNGVSDYELRSICDWAVAQGFSPSYRNGGNGAQGQARSDYARRAKGRPKPLSEEEKLASYIRNAERYLDGFRASEADLWEVSPIRPSEWYEDDARLVFKHLYEPDELINVTCNYFLDQSGHLQIKGRGITATAAEWCGGLALGIPAPQSDAGCWIRINPLSSREPASLLDPLDGSGQGGSFTDADVAVFKHHLLENDKLPLDLQLSLLARLILPIVIILFSAGRSYHAWVCSWARTLLEYRAESDRLCSVLEQFGFDRSNKNPSRYSRLPGVMRTLGGAGPPANRPTAQRIVYLTPTPKEGVSIL